jgi:signal peptidase I
MENAELKNEKGKRDYFTIIVILVSVITILLNVFVFQLAKVNGSSMEPTLQDRQLLIVYKLNFDYERGDIVIFKRNGTFLIKRLIGLPGETIEMKGDYIYINDKKIDDYIYVEGQNPGILSEKITLKEDEYFFIGDNRNNSYDSRKFGAINKKDIVGKVIFQFKPSTK